VIERARVRWLLGVHLPPFPPVAKGGGVWQQLKRHLGDGAGWRGLLYAPVALGWGIASFVITVLFWSVGLAGATFPLYAPWGGADYGDAIHGAALVALVVAETAVGWLVLAAAPRVIHGLARASEKIIGSMLSPGRAAVLEARVETLQESRDASVEGSALELRRIERDLHDGAQQRLVGLAMDLGLARERLAAGADPARAAELVERAHDEAKLAITELRDLVRGIHPAVLTDRGLDAALSAVAARCPIPVNLQVQLPDRPAPAIEAAAYFVVSEALTNVAKHSRAHHAWVDLSRREDVLVISVRDDGVGGAHVQPNGGLAGLRDRVTAVEGRLRLASPVEGPTTLMVELPWTVGARA
jgi:signal transduction histidine kinase